MAYTKIFKDIYPNGWDYDKTPITARSLNQYNDTIRNVEQYLKNVEYKTPEEVGSIAYLKDTSGSLVMSHRKQDYTFYVGSQRKGDSQWESEPVWDAKLMTYGNLEFTDDYWTDASTYDTDYVKNLKCGFSKCGDNYGLFLFKFDLENIKNYQWSSITIVSNFITYPSITYPSSYAIRESDGYAMPCYLDSSYFKLRKENSDLDGTWYATILAHIKPY